MTVAHKRLPDQLVSEPIETDICVIGAGPAGIAAVETAIAFGQRAVLVEQHKFGGISLNYGSVPAAVLSAAGNRASIAGGVGEIAVRDRIDDAVADLAANSSLIKLAGMGAKIVNASARFVGPATIQAGDYLIKARRFVIATGSSVELPQIAGLDTIPYFTTETLLRHHQPVEHLIVIGGCGIALQVAQAHFQLGAKVTIVSETHCLTGFDEELAGVVIAALRRQGLTIIEHVAVANVAMRDGHVRVATADPAASGISGSHLLLLGRRRPNIRDLGLTAAGVLFDASGVRINRSFRTSNRRVFAIGDAAAGQENSTATAREAAAAAMRAILFRLPARVPAVPVAVRTNPGAAWIGLDEVAARQSHGTVKVLRWPFAENDCAVVEAASDGHLKVIVSRKGRILGAGIAGSNAAELIAVWSLAIAQGLNISAMTSFGVPYPTRSEVNKSAALRYYANMPGNPVIRKIIALLAKLG